MKKSPDYDGPILEIDKLSISFFTRLREIPAVMDFSAKVMPGEALGLVGESGCGKSTVALGVMQDLGKNGRIVGGSIKFKGRDLGEMSMEELRDIRGNEIHITVSIGVASLPHPGASSVDSYITLADKALYRAKNDGRNRVRWPDEEP